MYPPTVLNIISSTTYPDLPSIADLESLQKSLQTQSESVANRISTQDAEVEKKLRKERRRKERLEEEAAEKAALEANERAGMKLEAIERNRIKEQLKEQRKNSPAVKKERTASPVPSEASSSFRPQKKKKRVVDSDEDGTPQTSGLKLKLGQKVRPDPSPTPSAIDFSLPTPPTRPLIPARPGVQKPAKPGPKRQADVDEDFSNSKTPSQVAFPTFWSGVEPYLRDVREDDLAMLGFKADAPESFDIPPRGRHYTETWDDEDGIPGANFRIPVPHPRANHLTRLIPTQMRDENLVDERGLGSFTERVVAAVIGSLGFRQSVDDGPRDPAPVDVVDLEDRMKKELRSVMLLSEHDEFDPSKRDDDEITSSLRQCQRLLLHQTAINESRKLRLATIAKHRLAYAEYQAALDGVEKSIEAGWLKRVKKVGSTKKAARPPVPSQLKSLVATRSNWVGSVGKAMKARPRGEIVGLPLSTVYDRVDDEDGDGDEVEDGLEVDDSA